MGCVLLVVGRLLVERRGEGSWDSGERGHAVIYFYFYFYFYLFNIYCNIILSIQYNMCVSILGAVIGPKHLWNRARVFERVYHPPVSIRMLLPPVLGPPPA